MGKYQSGQMGQTVNLLAYAFGGSNPSLPTLSYKAKLYDPKTIWFSSYKPYGLHDRNRHFRTPKLPL